MRAENQNTGWKADQLMEMFTNAQILSFLKKRGLHEFLQQIPSFQLRSAFKQKAKKEQEEDRWPGTYKKNVLDFTMKDLLLECRKHNLVDYMHYVNRDKLFRFSHHSIFGNRLVDNFPEEYYIGEKSTHFNKAAQLERQYGKSREGRIHEPNMHSSQEEGNDESSFIVDDDVVEEEEEEEEQQQESKTLNKQKKIKKEKKRLRNLRKMKKEQNQIQIIQIDGEEEEVRRACLRHLKRNIDSDDE